MKTNRYLVVKAPNLGKNHWMCSDEQAQVLCTWEQGKFEGTHKLDFRFFKYPFSCTEVELQKIAWSFGLYVKNHYPKLY